jgi:hypothetical protein
MGTMLFLSWAGSGEYRSQAFGLGTWKLEVRLV